MRPASLAATAAIVLAMGISGPAQATDGGWLPAGDWNSVVLLDVETGAVLQQADASQWNSVVLLDVETGKVLDSQAPQPWEAFDLR